MPIDEVCEILEKCEKFTSRPSDYKTEHCFCPKKSRGCYFLMAYKIIGTTEIIPRNSSLYRESQKSL